MLDGLNPDLLQHELDFLRSEADYIAEQMQTQFDTSGSAQAQSLVGRYLRLDQRFEALSSVVQLASMCQPNRKMVQQATNALSHIGIYIYHRTVSLINAWRTLVGEDERFLKDHPVHAEWLTSLNRIEAATTTDQQPADNQTSIGEGWSRIMQSASPSVRRDFDRQHVDAIAALLQQRIRSDPLPPDASMPSGLHSWARLNSVKSTTLDSLLIGNEYQEGHTYVREIQCRAGLNRCTLDTFRALEQDEMTISQLNVDEMIELVLTGLHAFDPEGACIAQRLVAEKRLAVLTTSSGDNLRSSPSLCLDTPFGAFVRVNFQSDMNNLMILMHELGHAIHYEKRRASGKGHIPLTIVASESAALSAERSLARWLMDQGESWEIPAQHYLRFQTMEMNFRHRMLARFELGLYRLPDLTSGSINQYWMQLNHAFYGPTIEFDTEFEVAWCEVHHLFTAPWYLLAYPLAIQQAPTWPD
ncbi:MAG: hypothetical protein WEB07_01090 [Natronospirillum sp.]